jgi:hypothetical protein
MARTFSKRDSELRKAPARKPESRQNAFKRASDHCDTARIIERVQTIIRTPEEALRLTEDIVALKTAGKCVQSVDALNIMDTWTQGERDTAEEMKRNVVSTLKNWQRYAEAKLRKDYLLA